MERLTERKYGEIVSSKKEREQIHCSNFCNNCSQGTGNCGYVKEMVEKLAEYEDAEEQGLLLRLPFQIGDKAFVKIKNEIREDFIEDYDIWSLKDGLHLRIRVRNHKNYIVGMFNQDIFKTKEEVEKALADMGCKVWQVLIGKLVGFQILSHTTYQMKCWLLGFQDGIKK